MQNTRVGEYIKTVHYLLKFLISKFVNDDTNYMQIGTAMFSLIFKGTCRKAVQYFFIWANISTDYY